MKKLNKFFAVLVVVALCCAMIPTILAAEPDVKLENGKLGDAVLEIGTPDTFTYLRDMNGDDATKPIGATGMWQRLPRNTLVGYGTVTPVNYLVPAEGAIEVSDPDVLGEMSFCLSRWAGNEFVSAPPCLQFNYKTLKAGTATVKLTYYYNYGLINVSGGCTWYKETATFTVTVTDEEVQMPDKPTEKDAKRFYNYVSSGSSSQGAVYLWCSESLYDHGAWFDYLTEVDGGYSFGEVKANDGSVLSKNTYPWVCEMTVDCKAYLDAYNAELGGECGEHWLCENAPETQTVVWYWNAAKEKWQYRSSNAPVYIDITHDCPTPEYTVTYTDGVEDEEIFADQVYTVKEGKATPAFDGTPERENYVFLGWEPTVAETVTADAVYTAKWEEALTDVTVTVNVRDGALLFLGSEIKVTAKANTSANITITPTLNGAFKQITSSTAADGTKTVWYRVTKIIGNYTRLSFTATATKGTQEPVTSTLNLGVNLRNRIHVTVRYSDGTLVTDATAQLMHKYPQWNPCPMLKYDAAKKEYVMANAWDLVNQPFASLKLTHDGVEYSVTKDKNGRELSSVIQSGTEEIYVEYVIVKPIAVKILVNGEQVDEQLFRGSEGEKLSYAEMQAAVLTDILASGKMITGLTTTGLNADNAAVFGQTEEVVITITTN